MCGNDRAKIDCAKSFEDIDFECFSEKDNDNDIEGPSTEKVVQVTKASQVKASRKRKRSFEVQDVVGDISIKFGEVTLAIGRMVNSRLDVTKLYEEVMAMKGPNMLHSVDGVTAKLTVLHRSNDPSLGPLLDHSGNHFCLSIMARSLYRLSPLIVHRAEQPCDMIGDLQVVPCVKSPPGEWWSGSVSCWVMPYVKSLPGEWWSGGMSRWVITVVQDVWQIM
ncbi:hypothetical protein FXO37_09069 [Capsicum annuum]|nr:hypothetical protein FXO37_09069 [Capsicum annuum]